MSKLIIYGVPIGDIEVVPPKRLYLDTMYYQDFKIFDVLKGEVSGNTVRVVQVGYDDSELARLREEKGIAVFVSDVTEFPGPLTPVPQILFLQDPHTGVFSVTGFRQGAFLMGSDNRVDSAHEFDSFVGLSVAQVKQRIEALSQP